MKKETVVLAYSGGLDTSYCVSYLAKTKNLQVHAVNVNTGGVSAEAITEMKKKAIQLGAQSFLSIDTQHDYYETIIKYLVFGNVLKNRTYPLSVSAERVFQAVEIVTYAKSINANYIAHGSTGAGNDQVRFDSIFHILAPEIEVLTPVRDQHLTRQEEITYLEEQGICVPWEQGAYSINVGLWGTSVGGEETLTSRNPLPEKAFPVPLKNHDPERIQLHFKKGELTGVNSKKGNPVELTNYLESLAAPFAIGRDIHVGDTLIGIKGRVGFAAAAPLLIIAAHHLLEKHTLSKWQLQHKEYIGQWYGTHLHEGHYLDPAMRDFEAFLQASQERVTGTIFATLHPYRFTLDGIDSEFDLLENSFANYGENNLAWSTADVKGFIKLYAISGALYQSKVKQKL